MNRARIAIVTPFLDKRHGTERCVAEQVERLARNYGYEIHLYSERVDDLSTTEGSAIGMRNGGRIVWRRVPAASGPHLVRYLWWLVMNHCLRWLDVRRGVKFDLVYSPGINAFDADVVSVHIVFREFFRQVRGDLRLDRHPVKKWPRLLQRRAVYRMIGLLERIVYRKSRTLLVAVSKKTASDLERWYGNGRAVTVNYHGVDQRFNPITRTRLRMEARRGLQLTSDAFVLLLIGNDWTQKGLPTLLEAVAASDVGGLHVLVAGSDDRMLFGDVMERLGVSPQVSFVPIRADVEYYYAAADCYVGPSLDEAFGLPPLEAMACGLPVIVSGRSGASEIVTDGVDAFVLKDPRDCCELRRLILGVYGDAALRERMGKAAVRTASKYSWDRNAAELNAVFESALREAAR